MSIRGLVIYGLTVLAIGLAYIAVQAAAYQAAIR